MIEINRNNLILRIEIDIEVIIRKYFTDYDTFKSKSKSTVML